MRVPVVGIDLDGVLVNFNERIMEKFTFHTGIEYSLDDTTNYDYTKCLEGVTPEIFKSVFKDIQTSRAFWVHLTSTSPEAIEAARDLSTFSHLYAVTARKECEVAKNRGQTTLAQSSQWLFTRDIQCAGVLRCDHGVDKGYLVSAMGCEYFLDDSPDAWLSCMEVGVNAYLLDTPYNQDFDTYDHGNDTECRIYSVREFVDMVKEETK